MVVHKSLFVAAKEDFRLERKSKISLIRKDACASSATFYDRNYRNHRHNFKVNDGQKNRAARVFGLWFVRKVVLKYHIVFTVDKLYESRDQLECIEVCLVTNRVA